MRGFAKMLAIFQAKNVSGLKGWEDCKIMAAYISCPLELVAH
jgi:hypothetical protein